MKKSKAKKSKKHAVKHHKKVRHHHSHKHAATAVKTINKAIKMAIRQQVKSTQTLVNLAKSLHKTIVQQQKEHKLLKYLQKAVKSIKNKLEMKHLEKRASHHIKKMTAITKKSKHAIKMLKKHKAHKHAKKHMAKKHLAQVKVGAKVKVQN